MESPQNMSDIKATLKGWKVYGILTKCGWFCQMRHRNQDTCAILGDSTCWNVLGDVQWIVSRITLSFPVVSAEESLAHLCPSLWGSKLSTGLVWHYLWDWHQANYTAFQSIFPFLYKQEKNPKQPDSCFECLRAVMGDHSVLVATGQSWPDFLCPYTSHLSLALCSIPCTKTCEITCVGQINVLKLFAFWQCQFSARSACSLSPPCCFKTSTA